MTRVAWLLLLAGCESAIEPGPSVPGNGVITILDRGGEKGQTGWWPSLKLDGEDQPHLSFCDVYHGDLKYATKQGGSWKTEAAVSQGAVGKYTALAINRAGLPSIAFYDQDTKYLRFATKQKDGTWKTERIAWGLEVGMGAELLYDKHDVPHLFYYIPSGKLIYAYRPVGSEWVKQPIASATGSYSIRINPMMRPDGLWLSFVNWNFRDTTLHLARPTNTGDFEVETVSHQRGPGWRSQLVFDGNDPRILFSQTVGQQLRVAYKHKTRWKHDLLVRRVGNFMAKQQPSGDLVIAYEDLHEDRAGRLRLLKQQGTAWQKIVVDDEGPSGSHLSLALSKAGRPMVAYYSKPIRGIKVYDETDIP